MPESQIGSRMEKPFGTSKLENQAIRPERKHPGGMMSCRFNDGRRFPLYIQHTGGK